MSDAEVAAEPTQELAENLLLKLEVEWIKEHGYTEVADPVAALAMLAIILATRKELRKDMSYYGFITVEFQDIQALIAGGLLGTFSIEMRKQVVQDDRHEETIYVYSIRAWSDSGNGKYAHWFKQTVAPHLVQPMYPTLNEEHLADIVEAALAIDMLRERSGFQIKTMFDKFPSFYAQLTHSILTWTPAPCQALGRDLPQGPAIAAEGQPSSSASAGPLQQFQWSGSSGSIQVTGPSPGGVWSQPEAEGLKRKQGPEGDFGQGEAQSA